MTKPIVSVLALMLMIFGCPGRTVLPQAWWA